MIDNKLTERMQAWLLMTEHDRKSIQEGADMVLQLNRNRFFYNQIMMRPEKMVSRVEYELRKHLKYRLRNMTLDDVKRLEAQVLGDVKPLVQAEVPESGLPVSDDVDKVVVRGKRADHDLLPEHIQQLWTENAERYKRMKQVYNTCMELEEACDRYEYAQQLQDAWRTYHATMERYDDFVMTPEPADTGSNSDTDKKYKNARSYISKNLDKLEELKKVVDGGNPSESDTETFNSMFAKLKERVDMLIGGNQVMGDEQRERLSLLGLLKTNTDSDGEGKADKQLAETAE